MRYTVPVPDNTLDDSSRQGTAQSGISLIFQEKQAIDAPEPPVHNPRYTPLWGLIVVSPMKSYRFPKKLASFIHALAIGALSLSAHAQTVVDPTDEQISAAAKASNQKRGNIVFWRSDKLGLIFGYDQRWKPVNASQKSTAVVVNWLIRASSGLMATCYIEATDSSDVARLKPSQITRNAKAITDAMLRNGRLRDPTMRLVTWRSVSQDNHPAIYLERDMRVENLGRTVNARLYSIVTAWKGREINFECASEVPITMPKAAGIVEGPIKTVLGSIQFIREPSK